MRRRTGLAGAGRLQPPLPSQLCASCAKLRRHRARRPAAVRAGPVRPRRPARLRAGVARRPYRSGGGELVDQGSHLIDLIRSLVGDVDLAFAELPTAVLADGRRGQRIPRARARGGGVAWLHASWTEWKNLFSFEVMLRAGQARGDRPGRQLRPGAAHACYEMGPSWARRRRRRGGGRRATTHGRVEIDRRRRRHRGAGPAIGASLDDAIAVLSSSRRRIGDDHHADAVAHLPRRRRHRPARPTTANPATAFSSQPRSRSTSTSPCTATSTTTCCSSTRSVERVPTAERRRTPTAARMLPASTGIDRGVEITSMADIPTGTGLGSSGSFTVGVLQGAASPTSTSTSPTSTSPREACEIEIDMLGEPIGKQDQYIAAVGGVTGVRVPRRRAGRGRATGPDAAGPRPASRTTSCCSSPALRRSASDELAEQQARPPAERAARRREPRPGARASATRPRARSRAVTSTASAALLTEQWQLKYERAPGRGPRRGRRVDPQRDRGRRGGRQARRRRWRRVPAVLRGGQGRRCARRWTTAGLEEVAFRHRLRGHDDDREPMTRTVAVLAGGLGTRVAALTGGTLPEGAAARRRPSRSSTTSSPRSRRLGVDRVVLLLGCHADQIIDHVGDGSAWGLDVDFVDWTATSCWAPAAR